MMTSTTAVDRRPRFPLLKKSAAILFWIAVWEIVSLCVGQELLVPSPAQVLVRLLQLLRETDFWLISAASLLRIMAGYLAAVVAAVFLAVLTSASSFLHALVSPLLGIIKATPVASFIILALVWLRGNQIPPFAAFLMVLPIIWANVSEGIRNTDRQLLEMGRMFRFGPWKRPGASMCQAFCPISWRDVPPALGSLGRRAWRQRCSPCRAIQLDCSYITPKCIWKHRICLLGHWSSFF